MMELSIPEYDIKITELPGRGLNICQGPKTYLAKDWTLSRQIYSIIRTAIKKGFTCLWTDNNPRADNPEPTYICFSRSNREPWDFKLNKEGYSKSFDGESLVEVITVNAKHKNKLARKVRFYKKTQKINGEERVKHLEVRPCDLQKLLNSL